ncbi:unnamed protein product [Protopolystoma xenopodis]|uniref:Uncharacterized protein n=1 Tax=Protopolystoma xenopodis TaxID=117903 RepID=A0A3S5BCV0_9PLAT|nr:unnamed protein product [Protopolystoma xenopodis]
MAFHLVHLECPYPPAEPDLAGASFPVLDLPIPVSQAVPSTSNFTCPAHSGSIVGNAGLSNVDTPATQSTSPPIDEAFATPNVTVVKTGGISATADVDTEESFPPIHSMATAIPGNITSMPAFTIAETAIATTSHTPVTIGAVHLDTISGFDTISGSAGKSLAGRPNNGNLAVFFEFTHSLHFIHRFHSSICFLSTSCFECYFHD